MSSDTVLREMIRFQTDRRLDKQEFDIEVASMNILEELLEAHGVSDNEERDNATMLYNALTKIVDNVKMFDKDNFQEPTRYDQVDAFCDIAEFAIGEPPKMGFDTVIALNEMTREINSRVGSIINGKFEKDRSPEAKANWYHANYSNAEIK